VPSAEPAGGARRHVVLAGHSGDVATAAAGLDDDDPAVRVAALGAMARLHELTGSHLRAALADAEPAVRIRAAEECARLADPATTPALVAALGDADDTVVEAAAHALGELVPPADDADRVVAALAAICGSHPEVVLRETSVAALGSLAGAGVEAAAAAQGLDAVLAATSDVATVRRRAVLALAAFEGDEVEAALRRLTADRDRQVRQAAEDLLR
jgi:HEAT repeat protein